MGLIVVEHSNYNKEGVLANLESLEKELLEQLQSRERLLTQLKSLDTKIERSKGLIIHRLRGNGLTKGNIFDIKVVNLGRNVKISELESVLPRESIFIPYLVVKVAYEETERVLRNELRTSKFVVDKVIERIKTLQSDYFDELVLRGEIK